MWTSVLGFRLKFGSHDGDYGNRDPHKGNYDYLFDDYAVLERIGAWSLGGGRKVQRNMLFRTVLLTH